MVVVTSNDIIPLSAPFRMSANGGHPGDGRDDDLCMGTSCCRTALPTMHLLGVSRPRS